MLRLSSPRRRPSFPLPLLHTRTFLDARIKWVRDRALDHAVEKEKHLLPFHSLKDLLILHSPSPSLPLSSIAPRRRDLRLPFRPIRFIRLFPAAFLESLPPPPSPPHPLVSPSPALLKLHDDELSAYSISRADAADRLLKLLMLCPRRRLPISLIDRLRWDLGLPADFPRSLLPDYPDYFRIAPDDSTHQLHLELVCYSKDLAVSAMERYAIKTGGYKKGDPLAFPLQFSRGFDLEKKVRMWVEDWQKLPYVSPYENGANLPPKSDIMEKWAVGMVHEILNLMVPKKTEKENLALLGEHVGLPSGFRKMIAHHPGIFYVSNKLRTQTVVLREAYRRDLVVEKHPLMGLRYQYIHLMHRRKEGSGGGKNRKSGRVEDRSLGDYDSEDEEEDDEEDDDDEDEDEDEEEILEEFDIDTEDEESDDDDEDDNVSCENINDLPRGNGIKRSSSSQASPIEARLQTSKNGRNTVHRDPSIHMKQRGRSKFSRGEQKLSPWRKTST